jgi:hypothetical protein
MPMIGVYAATGTFGDPHALAKSLATELMTIEQDVPQEHGGLRTRCRPRACRTSTPTAPTSASMS